MNNGRSNSFWYFNAGHIVSTIVTLVGLGVPMIWGSLNLRDSIRDSAREIGSLRGDFRSLSIRVEGIDNNGTHYSQAGIPREVEQTRMLNERVEAITKLQAELGPRLVAIERDLAWTRSFLQRTNDIPNPDTARKN